MFKYKKTNKSSVLEKITFLNGFLHVLCYLMSSAFTVSYIKPKCSLKLEIWASVFVGSILTHPGSHLSIFSEWMWQKLMETRLTHLLQSFLQKAAATLNQPAADVLYYTFFWASVSNEMKKCLHFFAKEFFFFLFIFLK